MGDLWPWLRLIGRRRGRLGIGLLLLALTLLAGIALLALAGWFLTAAGLAGLLLGAGVAVAFDVYVPGGGIRLFALTRTVSRYAERVYNHDTVLRLLADLRVHLFRGLARRPPAHRPVLAGANWLARLTSDIDSLDGLYLRLVAPLGLALVFSALLAVLTGWLLGATAALLVTLLLGLSLLCATWGLYRRTGRLAGERVDRLEAARGLAIEHLEGQAELAAAGALSRHQARLMAVAEQLSAGQRQLDGRIGWHGALATLLNHLCLVVVLWLAIAAFHTGLITGPLIVMLALALLGLHEAIQGLPEAFGNLGGTLAAARRLNQDTDGPASAASGVRPEKDERPHGLEFDGVRVAYPGIRPVLGDWSLTVAPGEKVGLVGRSGCGKSSLADMAAGLLEPPAGRCLLTRDGQGIGEPGARMARVSYLTQETKLFDDTLRENLRLALPEASDAELWRLLEAVDLAALVAGLKSGLDTWCGPYGHRLSGGEARRLVLARALLRPAPVLILDEPFTGLDRQTRERVCQGIRPYLSDRTLLVLGHDPEALPDVDRLVRLPD